LLVSLSCSLTTRRPRRSPLFPYTTLFRSLVGALGPGGDGLLPRLVVVGVDVDGLAPAQPGVQVGVGPGHAHHADLGLPRLLQGRSEEHTSELQSRENLVCRLLLEKKNTHT